jgi:hypothetical protein
MPREKVRVMNGFCKIGQHKECIGKSKGSKYDPVDYECTCECHEWNKKDDSNIDRE